MRLPALLLAALLLAGCAEQEVSPTSDNVAQAVQIATEAVAGTIEQADDIREQTAPQASAVTLGLREAVEAVTPEPLPIQETTSREAMDAAARDPGAVVITKYEIVSEPYYQKALKVVYCPRGKTISGPTGGIGYDFGHQTPQEIRAVWGWHPQIDAMVAASGMTGPTQCNAWLKKYGRIVIDLQDAKRIFAIDSLPKYRRMAERALPGLKDKTVGHNGGVTSTGYRRGWAMVGTRNRHKRVIRDTCMKIADQRESAECSATQTIAMCVIWEGTDTYKGQCRRSHDEAAVIRLS